MTGIVEILGTLEIVATAIENIRTIGDAVRDGKAYLEKKHPEAKKDVVVMLEEMVKTTKFVREASAVITAFRFVKDSDASATEFNALWVKQNAEAKYFRDNLDALRGHCGVIRQHADKIAIEALNGDRDYKVLFGNLFGLNSPQRDAELAAQLARLANEDYDVEQTARLLLDTIERALGAVNEAITSEDDMIDPTRLAAGAAILRQCREKFVPIEQKAEVARASITKLIDELR